MASSSSDSCEKSGNAPEQSTNASEDDQQRQSAPHSSATSDGGEGTSPAGESVKEGGAGDIGNESKSHDATTSKGAGPAKAVDKPKPSKIKVHLVAAGSAPILKKSKFLMNGDDRFAVAIAFLRKVLKLSSGNGASGGAAASALFLYVNAAFVPSPDERLGDLFDCFGTRGELVIHYALQEAWG